MDIGIDWARNSQLDRLSPVQVAVYRWSPANPARLSRNGRRSGRAARSPVVVPIAISRAYWLWNRSWATRSVVEPHPVRRDGARRRFVHVVPDPGDARGDVRRVELAPPVARLLRREVRERGVPRPHVADEHVAAVGAAQQVPLHRVGVDRPVGVGLQPRVDDRDQPRAALGEVGGQRTRVGELRGVPGEDPEATHVVDVEPVHVARHVGLAHPVGELDHLRLGVVVPAALVVPQRPQRRQLRPAGQPGVRLEHLGHPRAGDHVLAPLAPVERQLEVAALTGEVEGRPIGVVDERPRRGAGLTSGGTRTGCPCSRGRTAVDSRSPRGSPSGKRDVNSAVRCGSSTSTFQFTRTLPRRFDPPVRSPSPYTWPSPSMRLLSQASLRVAYAHDPSSSLEVLSTGCRRCARR